jgi:hypothetical protein
MKLYLFVWHLIYVYVIAETRDEALAKVRAPGSVARTDYPADKYPWVDFMSDPEQEEVSEGMITHFGCD